MLKNILIEAAELHGLPMTDLTVLSPGRDPYRLDTPAGHRLGKWLADAYAEVNPERRRLHLRGLHYALVGRVNLPNGEPYVNSDECWTWLAEKAAKAARFLGYLPWTALRDARNAPPQVFTPWFEPPVWQLRIADVWLHVPEDLEPRFEIAGSLYRQPWRQVVIAEKQGVEDLLIPVCQRRQATLVLPAGEISDTLVFQILDAANNDGRPLVIHQLGDADPAGHQMAVSTARTVQALRDSVFPDLEIRLHAPALTPQQCEEWDLPATPLKETERRADRWLAAMGREQTELDAAVALAPRAFVRVVENSLLQYHDVLLEAKAAKVRAELEGEANDWLEEQLGPETLAAIRAGAEEKIASLKEQIAQLNAALNVDAEEAGINLPDAVDVVEGEWSSHEAPLFDSVDDWATATRRLKARKEYGR